MSNVIAVKDALASAIHLANKALNRRQDIGLGIIPIQKRVGWFQLVLAENRGGALAVLMNKEVRTENVRRHVKRITRALKMQAKWKPHFDPTLFREDVYGDANFQRCWRSIDPKTLTPCEVGASVIVVPYNPT